LAAHEKSGAAAREDAVKFAADFYKAAGIADGDVVLTDGSGLFPARFSHTPRAIVQLLNYAAYADLGRDLPFVVAHCWRRRHALRSYEEHCGGGAAFFAKTGTVEHVVALSGYATTTRGAHLIFSILGNNNSLHAQNRGRRSRCDLP